MEILLSVWTYFAKNILQQPAFFIGLMVLLGNLLLRKKWYDTVASLLKAVVGYLILSVGSGGLVNNCRPILVGIKDKFQLDAVVIDPYYAQSAIDTGLQALGRSFSQVMILLLFAFIFNIVLVALRKVTKIRSLFTTGHIQVQQASIAFWIILMCFPQLGDTQYLLLMGILLGTYWAVGSNLTVDICQEMSDGGGFCVAHQQMFAIKLTEWLAPKIGGKGKKKSKRLEDLELPGWMSIFNDNVVSTSVIMLLFFGTLLLFLGKDFLIANKFLAENGSYLFYIITFCLNFAVYLTILQLGVRMFVTEMTSSFQGISQKLLPGAIPGIDIPAVYGYGSPNAITLGFVSAALGQFLAIVGLIVFQSPILIIAGFVPMFFGDGSLAVFANYKGGVRAALVIPFVTGIIAVLGSAAFAGVLGLTEYGGFMGLFDWVTVWQGFYYVMKYLQYIGVAVIVVGLLAIPQIQYRRHRDTYFLITDDFEAYKQKVAEKQSAAR
jgi:PTS system ascorbate-specific IIC component